MNIDGPPYELTELERRLDAVANTLRAAIDTATHDIQRLQTRTAYHDEDSQFWDLAERLTWVRSDLMQLKMTAAQIGKLPS